MNTQSVLKAHNPLDCDSAQALFGRPLRAALGLTRIGVTPAETLDRFHYAMSLGYPSVGEFQDKFAGETAIIVGGGPSVNINDITAGKMRAFSRNLGRGNCKIIAPNCSHDWLLSNGTKPDFGILLDPAERVAEYITPQQGINYLVGSTVHPAVWQRFAEAGVTPHVFVPTMEHGQEWEFGELYPDDPNICFVPGATTVGLRSVYVAGIMGFEIAELHGLDSCYEPKNDGSAATGLYKYGKPATHHDARVVTIASKTTREKFTCVSNGAMARQIIGFNSVVGTLHLAGVNGRIGNLLVRVAGDGAIPWMAWKDGDENKYVAHVDPVSMLRKYGDCPHWNYFKDGPENDRPGRTEA